MFPQDDDDEVDEDATTLSDEEEEQDTTDAQFDEAYFSMNEVYGMTKKRQSMSTGTRTSSMKVSLTKNLLLALLK